MKFLIRCGVIIMCVLVQFGVGAARVCNDCFEEEGGCVEVFSPLCRDLSMYMNSSTATSLTYFPNRYGHRYPLSAHREADHFYSKLEPHCGKYFREFICSAYVPLCDGYIDPCRAFCVQVRADCIKESNSFDLGWPENLRCEQFPDTGRCVGIDGQGVVTIIDRSVVNGARDLIYETNIIEPDVSSGGFKTSGGTCVELDLQMCKDASVYTNDPNAAKLTHMPNLQGQRSQVDAWMKIDVFAPIGQLGCSPFLRDFLCAVYAPRCEIRNGTAGFFQPCQILCEMTRDSCVPYLIEFGFQWPEDLRCEQFPETGPCIGLVGDDTVSVINDPTQSTLRNKPDIQEGRRNGVTAASNGTGSHVEGRKATNETIETGSDVGNGSMSAETERNRGSRVSGSSSAVVYTEWLRSNIRVNRVQLQLLKEKVAIARLEKKAMMKGQTARRGREKEMSETNQSDEETIST